MANLTLANPSLEATVRDAGLVRKIETALSETGFPQLRNVVVAGNEELVTLQGRVDTYYQKQLAQSTAMQVDGVEALRNEIVVH